jgi:hypothetical protein
MRIYPVLAICFLAFFTTSADKTDTRSESQFTVSLHEPNRPIKFGTGLRLKVTVRNVSDHDVAFERTPGATPDESLTYHVDIRDDRGQIPDETELLRSINQNHWAFGSYTRYVLKPGEAFDDEVDLARLYTLAKSGKYRIWVARGQRAFGGPPKDAVRSNEITVVVSP